MIIINDHNVHNMSKTLSNREWNERNFCVHFFAFWKLIFYITKCVEQFFVPWSVMEIVAENILLRDFELILRK